MRKLILISALLLLSVPAHAVTDNILDDYSFRRDTAAATHQMLEEQDERQRVIERAQRDRFEAVEQESWRAMHEEQDAEQQTRDHSDNMFQ